MKDMAGKKRFCETTGKLHIMCPHVRKSGVSVHVVVRDGVCYRSRECMVVECKFNAIQKDIDSLLSITW